MEYMQEIEIRNKRFYMVLSVFSALAICFGVIAKDIIRSAGSGIAFVVAAECAVVAFLGVVLIYMIRYFLLELRCITVDIAKDREKIKVRAEEGYEALFRIFNTSIVAAIILSAVVLKFESFFDFNTSNLFVYTGLALILFGIRWGLTKKAGRLLDIMICIFATTALYFTFLCFALLPR